MNELIKIAQDAFWEKKEVPNFNSWKVTRNVFKVSAVS